MPNWKKLITSGSDASLTSLTLTSLPSQGSEATSVMINSGGVLGTRELGSLAFSSATYDNYSSWNLKTNSVQRTTVGSGGTLDIIPGSNIGISYAAGGKVTISNSITNNNQLTNGAGYTTNTGTVTSVGTGDGLTQSGTSTVNPTLSVDYSNASDNIVAAASDGVPSTSAKILFGDTGGVNKIAFSSIPISHFNNDSNFTANVGDVTLSGTQTISGRKTFTDAVVLKGQASNYDSTTGRTSYWNYDSNVALALEPAADDGAVAIFFKSIGNSPSDFAYIAYDEDYAEDGVTAGENGALILGCENDGLGSSDHVRVKGRLVVEADMSSSDPTKAFQVKSSNTTSDIFHVNRAGGGYLSGTFNVTGDIVAYYSSDMRFKDNLIPIGDATEKVKKLTGYEFDWNDKQDVYEGHDIGVVAQEVEEVLPELVTTRDNGYKAVKYEKLVALLIESNKELSARIDKLEKQLK